MRNCDIVAKHPIPQLTLCCLVTPKDDESQSYIHTMDYTFSYCRRNLSVHARIHLHMLMVPKSEAEILNILKVL